jgi:hypothetical protein
VPNIFNVSQAFNESFNESFNLLKRDLNFLRLFFNRALVLFLSFRVVKKRSVDFLGPLLSIAPVAVLGCPRKQDVCHFKFCRAPPAPRGRSGLRFDIKVDGTVLLAP